MNFQELNRNHQFFIFKAIIAAFSPEVEIGMKQIGIKHPRMGYELPAVQSQATQEIVGNVISLPGIAFLGRLREKSLPEPGYEVFHILIGVINPIWLIYHHSKVKEKFGVNIA